MSFFSKIKSPFSGLFSKKLDDDLYDQLEETMISADVGVETSLAIVGELKSRVKAQKITDGEGARQLLRGIIAENLADESELSADVILVIGVNGVGKTTSIGKLAALYKAGGKRVILGAADTFRAAATEQLEIWAGRVGCEIVKGSEGQDPASVVFDTLKKSAAVGADITIIDTAGRLHNKKNLMDELAKISRVVSREAEGKKIEVLLVLDATTGQNGLIQAKEFASHAGLTGVIVTKLDGTAKGGIALAIKRALGVPVRFVGVGEAVEDLQPFSAEEFARGLVGD